ncbi:hypothetical protein [Pseudomonas agarici]|uniref:hypothetical protein n=1 Tax=Pseudomonas agarici TaxID=46677 RepID=UPI00115FDD8B|nr:hypothetical protein [Pseudomonas agarici]NWB89479.1 hypothetical protein [Pseudomonas agarici]NWC10460.1 hypothetical protein [Pseudomonas agarici]
MIGVSVPLLPGRPALAFIGETDGARRQELAEGIGHPSIHGVTHAGRRRSRSWFPGQRYDHCGEVFF